MLKLQKEKWMFKGDLSYFLHGRQNCKVLQFSWKSCLQGHEIRNVRFYLHLCGFCFAFFVLKRDQFFCFLGHNNNGCHKRYENSKTQPTKAEWETEETKGKDRSDVFFPSSSLVLKFKMNYILIHYEKQQQDSILDWLICYSTGPCHCLCKLWKIYTVPDCLGQCTAFFFFCFVFIIHTHCEAFFHIKVFLLWE